MPVARDTWRPDYFAMLIEYYVDALIADEKAADEVWALCVDLHGKLTRDLH